MKRSGLPRRRGDAFDTKEKRLMRWRIGGLAVACALLGLLPAQGRAQYQEVPPVLFTGPLSHPRYEDGGFFCTLSFLWMKQNNPMDNQVVGYRGFWDIDGSIGGVPGTHLGKFDWGMATDELRPGTFQPGWDLTMGWRFQSGVSVMISWWHLYDAKYSAVASTVPPFLKIDPLLINTFLSAPVVNFPPEYAGNDQNVAQGRIGATYGIWNAATTMTIDFVQRFDMFDITGRIPIWQTDAYRTYGLCGPRIVALWERFRWRTLDGDLNGQSDSSTIANYSNTISNRLYGVHAGGGWEWFLGSSPIGAWSISVDAEAGLYYDFVKARARYERDDRITANTRNRRLSALVPGLEAALGAWWYPWEGIQVHVGFDIMAFFNTVASPQPVDFNFGTLNPRWEDGQLRYLHGLKMGIGFVF